MIIAIDFDGTIADHRYPSIGAEVPGAFEWMKRFQTHGAKLILWTMRSDGRPDDGDTLAEAVTFCRDRGVEFFGVNQNPDQDWSTSPKAYANIYIDDAAAMCPLRENIRFGGGHLLTGRLSVQSFSIGCCSADEFNRRSRR